MYGSSPVSKDLNLPYPTAAAAAAAAASFKDSDHHQRQQQMSSGLLRYRSAPSSLFGETIEDLLPVRPSSPETDAIFARFLAATPDLIRDKPPPQFPPPPASAAMEQKAAAEHAGGFAPPQMLYHQQNHHQQLQSHVDGPYRSVEMEADQMKSGGDGGGIGGGGSNLIRHSSSPAGLFAHLNVENNGYGMVRGMGGGFRGGDAGIPPASRLKNQISFSSRQSSLMSQISEMGSEGMGGSSPEDSSRQNYNPGYQVGSWDDAPLMSEGFSGVKRARDDGGKLGLNQTEPQIAYFACLQNGELRSKSGLNSTDVAAIEKFLQFQDSVPCKIRAKRGCATHPRSIAERVRRTRISERMRKLQELVPNMDKQTNTADMLDLAVEYIKDLQKQVKTVSDSRANCTCSSGKQKPYSNPQA